jgi:hypothetical protein
VLAPVGGEVLYLFFSFFPYFFLLPELKATVIRRHGPAANIEGEEGRSVSGWGGHAQ